MGSAIYSCAGLVSISGLHVILQVADLGQSVDKLNRDKIKLEQEMEVGEVLSNMASPEACALPGWYDVAKVSAVMGLAILLGVAFLGLAARLSVYSTLYCPSL